MSGKWGAISESEFSARLSENMARRMADIDALTPEMRQLVHEYGWTVVRGFIQCGVTKPRRIRHLVETVLDEFSPTRGSFSKQGTRTERSVTTPERG